MEKNYQQDESYKAAQKRVKDIKGFYIHLTVYLFVNIAINLISFENTGHEPSSFFTAFFWGIGIAAHWASVFGPGLFLGKKWEEKKIRELMEKDKQKMQKWE